MFQTVCMIKFCWLFQFQIQMVSCMQVVTKSTTFNLTKLFQTFKLFFHCSDHNNLGMYIYMYTVMISEVDWEEKLAAQTHPWTNIVPNLLLFLFIMFTRSNQSKCNVNKSSVSLYIFIVSCSCVEWDIVFVVSIVLFTAVPLTLPIWKAYMWWFISIILNLCGKCRYLCLFV